MFRRESRGPTSRGPREQTAQGAVDHTQQCDSRHGALQRLAILKPSTRMVRRVGRAPPGVTAQAVPYSVPDTLQRTPCWLNSPHGRPHCVARALLRCTAAYAAHPSPAHSGSNMPSLREVPYPSSPPPPPLLSHLPYLSLTPPPTPPPPPPLLPPSSPSFLSPPLWLQVVVYSSVTCRPVRTFSRFKGLVREAEGGRGFGNEWAGGGGRWGDERVGGWRMGSARGLRLST